jgi:hypothetical protein
MELATLEKDGGSNTGAILSAKTLDVEHNAQRRI